MNLPAVLIVTVSLAAFGIVRSSARSDPQTEAGQDRTSPTRDAEAGSALLREGYEACPYGLCAEGHVVSTEHKLSVPEVMSVVGKRWRLQSGGPLPELDETELRAQVEQGRAATARQFAELEAKQARTAPTGSPERMEWIQTLQRKGQLDEQLIALDRGHFLIGSNRQICAAYGYCVRNFRHLTFVLMAETDVGRCIFILPDDPSSEYGKAREEFVRELARVAEAKAPAQHAFFR